MGLSPAYEDRVMDERTMLTMGTTTLFLQLANQPDEGEKGISEQQQTKMTMLDVG